AGLVVFVGVCAILVALGSRRGAAAKDEPPFDLALAERVRVEQALRREHELLQNIIDTIPVMITVHDPDTRRVRLNREFQRLVGWSSAEAAGASLLERCYPDPAYRERVRGFMDACSGGWMDVRMRTRDGRDLETSWANIRLFDQTRIGIGIDLT